MNFMDIVRDGSRALQSLGSRVRVQAEQTPDLPELWLSVRDLEGLAGRIRDSNDWQWREGFATLSFNGQDLGVLDELLDGSDPQLALTRAEQDALRALRHFLQQVSDRKFNFDEPA